MLLEFLIWNKGMLEEDVWSLKQRKVVGILEFDLLHCFQKE